jgi:hypothetical protein
MPQTNGKTNSFEPRRREGREGKQKQKIVPGLKQEKRLWFMVPFAFFAPSR